MAKDNRSIAIEGILYMHQTQLQVRLSLGGLNGYAEPKYVEDRVFVRITQVRNPSIPHHHFSFLFSMNEVRKIV